MKKLTMVTLIATLATSTHAQNFPSVQKSTIKQNQQAIKFSMKMLDNERINLKYNGYALGQVIESLEKINSLEKGEYESTNDFNARKSTALNAKFLKDSNINDTFAFVIPVKKLYSRDYISGNEIGYHFDADEGSLNFYIAPGIPFSGKSFSLNGINMANYQHGNNKESAGLDIFKLETKVLSSGAYKGSNAFGATVRVEKSNWLSYGIAADPIRFLNFKRDISYKKPNPAAQIILENSQAAKELSALKALIVMKLSDPYVLYNYYYEKPTRSSPIDSSTQEKYLAGEILGIIYFSGRSGEIFARLPEGFGKAEPTHEEK